MLPLTNGLTMSKVNRQTGTRYGWQFDYRLCDDDVVQDGPKNVIESVRHLHAYTTLNNAFDAAQSTAREMEDKLGVTIVQFYIWCYDA